MPYIASSQRYGSSRPVMVTHSLANIAKNMGRYQGSPAAPSLNRKRPAEEAPDSMRRGHPLPSRPQQPAYSGYGVRPGGFGGEAWWDQAGCGEYGGHQQHRGQQGYQRQSYAQGYGYQQQYSQQESQGRDLGTTHWRRQGWQSTAYQFDRQSHTQGYPTTGWQDTWQDQGSSNQRQSGLNWQQPTTQHPVLHPTSSASQAWQAEYFRQYQQYAQSLQSLLYQQFVPQVQTNEQPALTQGWQTAGNANTLSTAQLNANAAGFAPQAPPLGYAGTKPNVPHNKFTPANSSYRVSQTSNGQSYNAGTWYGKVPQRSGPAANTRSFRMESAAALVKNPKKHLLPIPVPTFDYTAQAAKAPETLTSPRSLLVILDLNGTLLYRPKKGYNFIGRPKVNQFLEYLFKNHHVIVWSSAKPKNVEPMCKQLLFKEQHDQLVALWTRDDLRLGKNYDDNPYVYKQLSWIWADNNIQAKSSTRWDQADTVLIDDTTEKAASEPNNILLLEEFAGKEEQMEVDVLGQVVKYMEGLRLQKDVSAYMRTTPFAFDPEVSFDWTSVL